MIKEKIVLYKEPKKQLPPLSIVSNTYQGQLCNYKALVTPYEILNEIKKAHKLNIKVGIVLQHQTIPDKTLQIEEFLPHNQAFLFKGGINFIKCKVFTKTDTLSSVYNINEIVNAYELV